MNWFWGKKAPKTSVSGSKGGGERAFAEESALSGGLRGEFAIRDYWKALESLSYLPNPDPILRSEGINLSTYRSMIDGHLGAVTRKRRAAVRSRPWFLDTPSGSSARTTKRVQSIITSLGVRSANTFWWSANLYGYSVLEVIWDRVDGWIVPVELKNKPQEWFGWNADGSLRFITDGGFGELVPERKFLVARHEPDFLNQYGKPLLSECFWPLAFKRGGLKFWATFAEKYGMPRAIGKVPPNASDAERRSLLSAMVGMIRDAALVISDNQKVELQESASKSASSEVYSSLVQWADTEISKAILGETLSTELGTTGSLAAAQVHNDVRHDLALDDAALLEGQWNQLIDWIYDLNSPGESVRARFAIQMPEDLQGGRVARDKDLHGIGANFQPEYFTDVYNIPAKYLAPADVVAPAPGPAFAEPVAPVLAPEDSWRPDDLSQALAAKLAPQDVAKHQQEIAGRILDLANKAQGFAEFSELLMTEFPDLPVDAFQDTMESFCLIADLAGRSDAAHILQRKLDQAGS